MVKIAWGFALALMLIAAGAVAGPSESPAEQKEASKAVTDVPGKHFQKARQDFLKKDAKDAADEIRKGGAFLKKESERAAGEAKETLTASADETEKLAEEVEKGTVTSVKKLDESFARADHALARYHYANASESWARRETAKAGHEIKEATAYLERGLGWTGQKIESGTRTAIRDGRLVAGKLIEGTGWVPEEVGKGFEAVGREVEEFGKRVAVAKR